MKLIYSNDGIIGICAEVNDENIQSICEAQSLDNIIIKIEDVEIVSRRIVKDTVPVIEEIEYEFTATTKNQHEKTRKSRRVSFHFRLKEIDEKELKKYQLSKTKRF